MTIPFGRWLCSGDFGSKAKVVGEDDGKGLKINVCRRNNLSVPCQIFDVTCLAKILLIPIPMTLFLFLLELNSLLRQIHNFDFFPARCFLTLMNVQTSSQINTEFH